MGTPDSRFPDPHLPRNAIVPSELSSAYILPPCILPSTIPLSAPKRTPTMTARKPRTIDASSAVPSAHSMPHRRRHCL
ncbi:hypothetical protein BD779DRAFT_1144963 [Infundibulicybe gibba]|nr:hypothetical protein BD779DRAFT_1144963 [Infundibulicybe gibba]